MPKRGRLPPLVMPKRRQIRELDRMFLQEDEDPLDDDDPLDDEDPLDEDDWAGPLLHPHDGLDDLDDEALLGRRPVPCSPLLFRGPFSRRMRELWLQRLDLALEQSAMGFSASSSSRPPQEAPPPPVASPPYAAEPRAEEPPQTVVEMIPPKPDAAEVTLPVAEPAPIADAAPAGGFRRLRRAADTAEPPPEKSHPEKKKAAKARRARVAGAGSPALPWFAFEWFRDCKEKEGTLGLQKLIELWKELSKEERESYAAMADEDRRRFEAEYAEWKEHRAGGEDVEVLLQKRSEEVAQRLQRAERQSRKEERKEEKPAKREKKAPPQGYPEKAKTAYALFCKAQAGLPREEKGNFIRQAAAAWKALSLEEKQRYETLAAQDEARFREELEKWLREQQPDGEDPSKALTAALKRPRRRLPAPRVSAAQQLSAVREKPTAELTMNDIFVGAALVGLEEEREERRQRAKEVKEASAEADSGLPEPQGVPSAMRPGPSVDDLLGGLTMEEASQEEDRQSEFSVASGAVVPREEGLPAGPPQVLGPQLRLDEAGNIVLDQNSLTHDIRQEAPSEAGAPVREAVSHYSSAYRRTPACKWSEEETGMFYEALALYGTDLFLVQTFFRNKSAAQIKAKYGKELKKRPDAVQEALTTRAQKLTKATFENLHGKIDVSKHYRPPPSPLPGEEPERDGSMPTQDEPPPPEADTPPPEPEYSAEDESLTTNRLMALFD